MLCRFWKNFVVTNNAITEGLVYFTGGFASVVCFAEQKAAKPWLALRPFFLFFIFCATLCYLQILLEKTCCGELFL